MKSNCYSHCYGATNTPKSPAEINMEQAAEARKKTKQAHMNSNVGGDPGNMREHDTVRDIEESAQHEARETPAEEQAEHAGEVSMGPVGDGMVPANPFASLAQEGYLHAHPEKLGAKKLAEFDRETKGMKLPNKVKK